jgi:hypothetical protein
MMGIASLDLSYAWGADSGPAGIAMNFWQRTISVRQRTGAAQKLC